MPHKNDAFLDLHLNCFCIFAGHLVCPEALWYGGLRSRISSRISFEKSGADILITVIIGLETIQFNWVKEES